MYNNFVLFSNIFEDIKRKKWVKSLRKGSTGVGYTFESLFGKKEDSLDVPDFNEIEIKTHRSKSISNMCLFNCNPIGSSSYELKRIFDCYGYRSTKDKTSKVLNASVYSNYIVDVGINYKFSLRVDYEHEKIYLLVFDRLGIFIEKNSFWTFEQLREKLYKKMQYLAYVEADSKFFNGDEYFYYKDLKFFKLKDFDTFVKLIDDGIIRISFLIGSYLSGEKKGQIRSHGTSFNINPKNLELLYEPMFIGQN